MNELRLARGIVGAVAAVILVFLGALGNAHRVERHAEAQERAAGQAVATAAAIDRELSTVAVDLSAFNTALNAGVAPGSAAVRLSSDVEVMRSKQDDDVVFEAVTEGVDPRALRKIDTQMRPGVHLISPAEVVFSAITGEIITWAIVDLSHILDQSGVELRDETMARRQELARTKGWTVLPDDEDSGAARALAATSYELVVVASAEPKAIPLGWSLFFWVFAAGLAGSVAWICAGYRKQETSTDDQHKSILLATVGLVREAASASDVESVLAALERALNKGIPDPKWYVFSAASIKTSDVKEVSFPVEELQRILDDAAGLTGQHPAAVTQAICSPALSEAGNMLFIVRDVSEVYGMAIAIGYDLNQHLEGGAELLLRVAAVALRSVSLLHKLVASEQEATVGRLAAGIAHEVNNPLAYVKMNLETVRDNTTGELCETAKEAIEGVRRVEQVIRGIRVLFRGSEELVLQDIDLSSLVENTTKIASARRVGTPIEVITIDRVVVHGDEVGLGQTLLNLLTNAVDAVMENTSPKVEVRIFRTDDEDVVIDIEDNGPGVGEDMRSRIFDAFVSGKGKRGTGLGLGIARSFARAHGGDLHLEQTGPHGSIFRLTLPASAQKTVAAFRSTAPPITRVSILSSQSPPQPEILIIDDEVPLVRALSRWLRDLAIVTGATTPTEGLELASSRDYALILCDLNMPGMSGLELIEALEERTPTAAKRLVIMTGSIDTQLPGRRVLTKPISRDTVLTLLKEVA